ncbi:MAG: hypothetical protein RIF41_07390 [Polyangiaceae bacterium]
MTISETNLGFSVADAEGVEVAFESGDVDLRFTDWRENPVFHKFVDVLAFRWGARPSVDTPRDDMTYEVSDSTWLAVEAENDGCSTDEIVHLVLCFNAVGVLEIICRRAPS